MRRWIIAGGIVLVTTVGATIHVRQAAPRSALGDAVGVRRSRPFGRFCGWFIQDARVVTYPTGAAVCAWGRPDGPERRAELDQLKYHVVTRRVFSAERSWEPLREQAWRRDLDSVRTALREQGGVLSCASQTPKEVREYWRFPHFDVSLYSGGVTPPAAGVVTGPPRWFLFLRGAPGRLRVCESVPSPPV